MHLQGMIFTARRQGLRHEFLLRTRVRAEQAARPGAPATRHSPARVSGKALASHRWQPMALAVFSERGEKHGAHGDSRATGVRGTQQG